ncbi:hypothetical protein [Dyadobacter luticola]|uniref:Lipoprotein n=1 Tax=Dyadobacter luticola TaxID=1979387 RepID=A0A5R9L4G1_9BACT|nr:hypothetical protein [Dyadobacter luticola]TLV03308.1 hypothetical protein FEN17_06765 [Dyadobacter luticola]
MKKTILFAMLCLAAVACDKKENTATPQIESKATVVPYRQATTVSAAGESLKVDLREVSDSRCPIDAICITAGNAQVKFNVSDDKNQAEVNVTYKGDKNGDFQTFTLSGVNYVLRVSEVLPFPETTKQPKLEDYKVNVTIERK